MKISERHRRNLVAKGVRVEKVERQVAEIEKALYDNGFTFGESQLIVESLANDIEEARYHSPMTLLVGIDVKTDPETAQPNHQ